MLLKVPLVKSVKFNYDLLSQLEDLVSQLTQETGKLPSYLVFNGPLGKEVLDHLLSQNWDLSTFKLTYGQAGNNIEGGYDTPIDSVETRGAISDSSLNGKIINGIPGPETLGKILGSMYSPQFTIEKKIKPSSQIKLIRE